MRKLLPLGKNLRYPITITKLHKGPGESFRKQDKIFEYTFTWLKDVGDPFGETWQEKQTTPADWDSPADGTILEWKIQEGMVFEQDVPCVEIDEACSHSVQFAGLCALCGKDMNESNWATDTTDASRATINMIHDQTLLSVSVDEASRAESQLQRRLLNGRKLSLVVDLDQTIIHACIEPTIGEWQRDPNSPNYEAVKSVKAFQLNDDGPRGLASGCWYYIKMRPGLEEFLAHVAELYELHVYTMGTRAYAQNIAKIVDPEHKLFGDRIISRDENGSLTAKSLSRIFPVDTKMVVIIDDRADVWPKNRPNLIKVVPYDFFVGIGDINSSFLPKREDIPKATGIKLRLPDKTEKKNEIDTPVSATTAPVKAGQKGTTGESSLPAPEKISNEPIAEDGPSKISALQELVSMGGGDDPTIRQIQTEEQEQFLEKQLTERPLLHMQQELDKEDVETDMSTTDVDDTARNGDVPEQQHQRHHLLKDDDTELIYLEEHLTRLHKAFYEEYDATLANAQGGRVAALRPGATKKIQVNDDSADLKIVPDIGDVMPRLKAKTLEGTVIVLSGLVPLGADVMRSEIVQQAMSFGAQVQTKVSRKVTHVVVSASRTRTQKVRQAAKYPNVIIVNQQWLMDSMSKWRKEDESQYLIEIPREDRGPNASQSAHSSDEASVNDDSEDDGTFTESRDEQDPEGVMPDDLDDPQSPIDGLRKFDWGSVDDELKDFLDDDDDEVDDGDDGDDSDASSVASESSSHSRKSKISVRGGKKHPRTDAEEEETDEESNLAKKQRLSRVRTTGLKTVKTPTSANSESSLPTPDITGGEEVEYQIDLVPTAGGGDIDDDAFEADMMAAFDSDEDDDENWKKPPDDEEG